MKKVCQVKVGNHFTLQNNVETELGKMGSVVIWSGALARKPNI